MHHTLLTELHGVAGNRIGLEGVKVSLEDGYIVSKDSEEVEQEIKTQTLIWTGGVKTKSLVNMYYLFEVNGFNLIWDYIEHQFKDFITRRC
ncbi:hypothetical protein [Halanaerobaculum tunisiense]